MCIRDSILSGLFADGTRFDFDLNSVFSNTRDTFDSGATLTITRVVANVPDILVGDVNTDGTVNFLDISPFITVLATGGNQAEADINQSGFVDFLDISPFIVILTGS